MIIQSGISSPSLTRRVRCFFQNELLTSQLSRRCCAARALMIRLLLNLLTRMFRNSACFSADITWSGLGENHSLGGVFVHRGLVSASINNLCREFLGIGERNEWTVTPPCRSKRKHSGKNLDSMSLARGIVSCSLPHPISARMPLLDWVTRENSRDRFSYCRE